MIKILILFAIFLLILLVLVMVVIVPAYRFFRNKGKEIVDGMNAIDKVVDRAGEDAQKTNAKK